MNKIRTKIAKYIASRGVVVMTHNEFEDALHVAQHSAISDIMEHVRVLHGEPNWGEKVWKYICRKFEETK